MQFFIHPHGLVSGRSFISLLLILVHAQAMKSSLSMKDTVGLISRVDVQRDGLGDLGDASFDVDAPEKLELPPPPRAHVTPGELALVQAKVAHKDYAKQATHKLKVKKTVAHKAAKEVPQAALALSFEKSSQAEAKAADADVDQLGGQLQSIMSDLAAPDSEKEQDTAKKVSSPVAMDVAAVAADSGDDAAMEKEVEATKPGDAPKDESENVVDGAMAYIRTRVAAEEHKSLRLRQLLQQSVRGNKDLREKIEQLHKELAVGLTTQKNLRGVATQKLSQKQAELVKETSQAETLAKELHNATRAAKIGEKTMKVLGMKLKYSKSQVAALLLNLANSTEQNKELHRRFETLTSTEFNEAKRLADSRKTVSAQAQEIAEMKAKIQSLVQDKAGEDDKLKKMDRNNDFLEQWRNSAGKRDGIMQKENGLLKKQLKQELSREEQLREMWSKESEAFTWQLRAERANASESLSDLEKARSEFRDLRQRVEKLRSRASVGEKNRHQAEDAANRAQFALAEASAENKQLKGSVPWLEAEVDRQRIAAQNATKQAMQSQRERDTVKAILGEAQKSIVQLQGQYADALQALVVAQAGNGDTSKQAPVASSIQQFAALDNNPLGPPPQVSYVAQPGAQPAGESLLELGRDSTALNSIMTTNQVAEPRGKVDLGKNSEGLNAVLRGMNGQR